MKIVSVEIEHRTFPLPSFASNAQRSWRDREVLLLEIRDERNNLGLGEASPLPGYSPDTLSECRRALDGVDWKRAGLIDLGKSVTAEVESVLGDTGVSAPAARFAIETALFDLIGKRLGQPMYRLLGGSGVPDAVPLATLLDIETHARAIRSARLSRDRGIRTFKVKLRRYGASEWNFDILKLLRDELGNDVALRADANGSFTAGEAPGLVKRLVDFHLEFVEEPCDLKAMAKWQFSPVPLALDESLQDESQWSLASDLIRRGLCKYVILKPAALGGTIRSLQLAVRATALGAQPVVTHMFDGPVGFAASAALALSICRGTACGLDGYSGLSAWPELTFPCLTPNALVATELPGLGLQTAHSGAVLEERAIS